MVFYSDHTEALHSTNWGQSLPSSSSHSNLHIDAWALSKSPLFHFMTITKIFSREWEHSGREAGLKDQKVSLKMKHSHGRSEWEGEEGAEGMRSGAEAEGRSRVSRGCWHQIHMRHETFPDSTLPLERNKWLSRWDAGQAGMRGGRFVFQQEIMALHHFEAVAWISMLFQLLRLAVWTWIATWRSCKKQILRERERDRDFCINMNWKPVKIWLFKSV